MRYLLHRASLSMVVLLVVKVGQAETLLEMPEGVDQVTVPMTIVQGKMLVQAKINNQDAGWFVVDTGADLTMVDRPLANRLELNLLAENRIQGISGRQSAAIYRTQGMSIGDLQIKPSFVMAAPLGQIGDLTGLSFNGLIGAEVLGELPFTVDPAASTITFHRRATFQPPAGAREHKLRFYRNMPAAEAKLNERITGWFMIDTGLDDCLMLSAHFKHQHETELIDGRKTVPSFSWSVGGVAMNLTVKLDSLEVFGRKVASPTAGFFRRYSGVLMSIRSAGIIGWQTFGDLRLTFDYKQKKLWTQPLPAGKPQPWRLDGIDPNDKDLAGGTDLMYAAMDGDIDTVRELIEAGADPKAKTNNGVSALMYAARGGHEQIVRLLLKHGADPNNQTTGWRESVLGTAAFYGSSEIVKLLIDAGAQVERPNQIGATPLIRAVRAGNVETVKVLLGAKANPDRIDKTEDFSLGIAAAQNEVEIAKILLDAGASVNTMNRMHVTAVYVAAREGQTEMIDLLLDHGARIDMPDASGLTPLIAAVSQRHETAVALLLKRGADISIKDKAGKSALDYAAQRPSLSILRLIAGENQLETSKRKAISARN